MIWAIIMKNKGNYFGNAWNWIDIIVPIAIIVMESENMNRKT